VIKANLGGGEIPHPTLWRKPMHRYISGLVWSGINLAILTGIWYGLDYMGWSASKTEWSPSLFVAAFAVGWLSYQDGWRAK